MYIDNMLIEMFEHRYDRDYLNEVERHGVWYTLDGIRAEEEDFNKTLAEAFADYYYVIDENKILFCSAEQFINSCDEEYEVVNYGGKK